MIENRSIRPSRAGYGSRCLSAVPALLLAIFTLVGPASGQETALSRDTEVRFAFSKAMFQNVNQNDVKAAMKVYTKNIVETIGIDMGGGPIFLDGTNAIAEALRRKQFDMISLTAEEYLALESEGLGGPFLVSQVNQSVTEEFVMLVRTESSVRKISDLPGHSLIIATDLRSLLVPVWLEVLCRGHGLGPANSVFPRLASAAKPSEAVLSVFFGKADACVTTRNNWNLMGELNPQVQDQLRVVASSPPVVPGFSCFREDLSGVIKKRLLAAAASSEEIPSFKQLLALFKIDKLSGQPVSVLDDTRRLLATYHHLCAGSNDFKLAR